ncbi:DNA-binding CsgD family transcriptional regulator [Arthrobacter globiformis]|uniref:AAA family ATPase n=1 Tax=Arthrobacter globiformis TaxID=1665 RepID=UPI00277F5FC1|nr:LuxR family transcriptional regulator [Arthrobacter globiformis]MDQ1058328.1 DNA-binding CsgD family transcriptional regulator [Arthrobacter globiformis]
MSRPLWEANSNKAVEEAAHDRVVGRDEELSRLTALIAGAGKAARALIIEGDPGTGKSILLNHAERQARKAGFRTLRCTGMQGAAAIGFNGLHEMLYPILHYIDAIPPRQREALMTALAMLEGPPPGKLQVCVAALSLLEEAAADKPIFIGVDDLHWVDHSSTDVITFVSLRLENSPIALLASTRPRWDRTAITDMRLERLLLGPLNSQSSEELITVLGAAFSPSERARVLREAEGNPLALCELSVALRRDGVADTALHATLPTTKRLEHTFLSHNRTLPERSQKMLLLAAVADDANLSDLLDAARTFDLTFADFAPLERAGLIRIADGILTFRHPVLRSAIQGAATSDEIRRAHEALALSNSDPDRATWHRAAATLGQDETIAAELDNVARRAEGRGALIEAAVTFRKSAMLSPKPAKKASRLASAASIARSAGKTSEALESLEHAELIAEDADTVSRLAMIRSILSLTAGVRGLTRSDLDLILGKLTGPENVEHRTTVLWCAALSARGRNSPKEDRHWLQDQLCSTKTPNPLKTVALAVLEPLGGIPELRTELPQLVSQLVDQPLGLVSLAIAAESLQDTETALTAWSLAYERFAARGAAADEVQALRGRAGVRLLWGQVREGLADAEYAMRMARDTSQPMLESTAAATVARANALLGDFSKAQAALAHSRELMKTSPLAVTSADTRWAAGLIALGQQRFRDALIEFTHMSVHPTRALWAIADRAEAAVRAGRPESILENVAQADTIARAYRSPLLASLVERSKALLAAPSTAVGHFERAIQHGELSESALELARTQLLYGEWLRRDRQPAEARIHLSAALQAFNAAGAAQFADRAAKELRAAGEVPRTLTAAAPSELDMLTPQELQIATLASRGLSNKEIADQIYLSHRTVSTHLYRVFPKLGITSRFQLREAFERIAPAQGSVPSPNDAARHSHQES